MKPEDPLLDCPMAIQAESFFCPEKNTPCPRRPAAHLPGVEEPNGLSLASWEGQDAGVAWACEAWHPAPRFPRFLAAGTVPEARCPKPHPAGLAGQPRHPCSTNAQQQPQQAHWASLSSSGACSTQLHASVRSAQPCVLMGCPLMAACAAATLGALSPVLGDAAGATSTTSGAHTSAAIPSSSSSPSCSPSSSSAAAGAGESRAAAARGSVGPQLAEVQAAGPSCTSSVFAGGGGLDHWTDSDAEEEEGEEEEQVQAWAQRPSAVSPQQQRQPKQEQHSNLQPQQEQREQQPQQPQQQQAPRSSQPASSKAAPLPPLEVGCVGPPLFRFVRPGPRKLQAAEEPGGGGAWYRVRQPEWRPVSLHGGLHELAACGSAWRSRRLLLSLRLGALQAGIITASTPPPPLGPNVSSSVAAGPRGGTEPGMGPGGAAGQRHAAAVAWQVSPDPCAAAHLAALAPEGPATAVPSVRPAALGRAKGQGEAAIHSMLHPLSHWLSHDLVSSLSSRGSQGGAGVLPVLPVLPWAGAEVSLRWCSAAGAVEPLRAEAADQLLLQVGGARTGWVCEAHRFFLRRASRSFFRACPTRLGNRSQGPMILI